MTNNHTAIDKTGVSLSALCIVHCLAGPALLAIYPATHSLANETLFHTVFAPILLGIAALAFYRGYRKHGKAAILGLGISGISFLVLGILFHDHMLTGLVSAQVVLSVFGSILLIWAHVWNIRSCRCEHA